MSDNDQRSAELEEQKTNGDKIESLSSLKRPLDDSEDIANEQPQEKKITLAHKSEVASEKVETIASEQVDTTASEQVVITTEQAETNSEQEKLANKIPDPVKNEPANSADFNSTELKTSSEQQSLDDNSSEDNSETVEITAKPEPEDHQLNSEPNSPASMGSSGAINDIIDVPDRMVGLIIGKGGEQISNIQSQSGARVQFAPDSEGRASRTCSLSGTPEAIQRAKEIIQRIIEKGQGLPDSIQMDNGVTMIEMNIPGHKAGLVIGKSGETIKQLQERTGVKMVLIQDSNQATFQDKPLRITGPPDRCQRAKEMIMDLLAKKDAENASFGSSEFGNRTTIEVMTPRSLVGIIIGKSGDMIKKITNETSCRIQFKPDDGQLAERACMVMGPVEGATRAARMVQELIDKNMDKIDMRPPKSSGGGGGGRSHDNYDRGGNQQGGYGNSFTTESTFVIPADKCGLVIGKGGDTIREINRVSGGFVELARQQNQGSNERVFNVRGTPDQIQHAVRLICEKAGLPPPPAGGPGSRPPQGGPMGGGPMGFDQFGQFSQQFGGQPGLAPQQPGVPQQFPGYANFGAATPAASSWPGYQQQPTTAWAQPAQPDPSKQSSDPWAAYYAAFYAQQQQQVQPQALAPQPAVQQPAPVQQLAAQPAQQTAAAGYPQPTINPQTGQLDYSAAWAEYYRQQGMYSHAQAVLSGTAGAGPQQPR